MEGEREEEKGEEERREKQSCNEGRDGEYKKRETERRRKT